MSNPIRRLGLYGGSFDPVHNGHLILAREAREKLGLDLVVFLPAALSPHKRHRPPASAQDRLALLRAAVADEPGFAVDDFELRREGISYAIDTIREMESRHPEAELFFFLGDDNLSDLDSWREIETVREKVQFVVLSRGGARAHDDFPVIERRIDISSTDVRNRIARGLSVRFLLPEAACKILADRRLYQTPPPHGR